MNITRRALLTLLAALAPLHRAIATQDEASDARRREFVEEAFAMKREAEVTGDQSYGAVIVCDDAVVGWGPSRVVVDNDPDAHAERVALRDAQTRLGRTNLSDCMMYSTSRPCGLCERAAATAGVTRMYYGTEPTDAGPPQRR